MIKYKTSNTFCFRTENDLDESGISVAPPKRTRSAGPVKAALAPTARLRIKGDSDEEETNSGSDEKETDSEEESESEESGESEESDHAPVAVAAPIVAPIVAAASIAAPAAAPAAAPIAAPAAAPIAAPAAAPIAAPAAAPIAAPIAAAAAPVAAAPISSAAPVSAPVEPNPVIVAPVPVAAIAAGAPSIAILPATPVKKPGQSSHSMQVTPGDYQEDEDELDPDVDMGDSTQLGYGLKRGRERSGSNESRVAKSRRRSASQSGSHSTAPTVPSTRTSDDEEPSSDELDPRGSSRTTGGSARGKAAGDNYHWADGDDEEDPNVWNAPTKGKVMIYAERELGSRPHMSFRTKTTSELPVILKELSGRFSPIQKMDSRIYVYEDNIWEVKGRFSQAVKDDSPVKWEVDTSGNLFLDIFVVSVILMVFIFIT